MRCLPIYMKEVKSLLLDELTRTKETPFVGAESHHEYFGPTGRWLLNELLSNFNLSRSDVISIFTTTNDTYLSSCVTLTAFNHCTISRTLTKNTKVAIIVHEFGYVHPEFQAFCEKLKEQGIVIIEDCAHVLGLTIDNNLSVGSVGDYSIYSLPKVLPVNAGGLLRSRIPILSKGIESICCTSSNDIKKEYLSALPLWQSINQRRHTKHQVLKSICGEDSIIIPANQFVPYFTYLKKPEVIKHFSNMVEFGASLRKDIALVPTNPFVPDVVFESLANLFIGN